MLCLADTSNSLSVVLSNEFKGHTETRRRPFVFAVTVLSAAPRHKRSSLQESGQNVDRRLRSLQLRVYSAEQIFKNTQSRDHSSKRLQEKTGSRTRYLRLGLPCLLPPSAAVSPAPSHRASCEQHRRWRRLRHNGDQFLFFCRRWISLGSADRTAFVYHRLRAEPRYLNDENTEMLTNTAHRP